MVSRSRLRGGKARDGAPVWGDENYLSQYTRWALLIRMEGGADRHSYQYCKWPTSGLVGY